MGFSALWGAFYLVNGISNSQLVGEPGEVAQWFAVRVASGGESWDPQDPQLGWHPTCNPITWKAERQGILRASWRV